MKFQNVSWNVCQQRESFDFCLLENIGASFLAKM